ncbi:MAG TPA: DUF309 domain-containing protein [Mycobacteriales bacterium]
MAADPQRDQNLKRGGQRDRGADGRPRQARPRDALGRPLPHGDPHGVPPVSEEALPPTRALELAQSLLDAGRAFSAHEVLEAVWKAAPPAERDLWQGLAQVCVGITHHQRGNPTGMVTLFDRAAHRLDRYSDDRPYGVDVAGLLRFCAEAVATSAVPDTAPGLTGGP